MQMDDPSIFPQHYGEPFPPSFQDVICAIFKRLFRVYAHIYHSHFKHICALKEEAHLNTCFKHFMYFTEVSTTLEGLRAPPYSTLWLLHCSIDFISREVSHEHSKCKDKCMLKDNAYLNTCFCIKSFCLYLVRVILQTVHFSPFHLSLPKLRIRASKGGESD